MAAFVLLILALAGSISLLVAVVGAAAIGALATFYHLSVNLSLRATAPQPKAGPSRGEEVDNSSTGAAALLDKLPLPVVVVGQGGRIESANPAARDFLGLAETGGHLSGALRQPSVLEAVGEALLGNTPAPVEYSTMAPGESHVRAVAAPVRNAGQASAPWRAMLVLFDETSIKRSERMRADFLANASHELRTPLASLSGFIETLRGHAKDDPEARDRFLSIMHDQSERMRRLINDLLSLSRVEMDEHVPPSDPIDLNSVTEDVIAFLKPQSEAKLISLSSRLEGQAVVTGDRDQLTEVVQNLIENAIKYSPERAEVTVTIRTGLDRDQAEWPRTRIGDASARLTLAAPQGDPPGGFVVLRISDSGKGIDRRDLPRLSERFYRVGGQKSGPKEGTGLGLAIVKHILNRHRAGFTVESQPGHGTVFSAILPAFDGAQAALDGSVRDPEAG